MYLMYIQYLSSPTRPAKGGDIFPRASLFGGEGMDDSVKCFAQKLSMHCLWGGRGGQWSQAFGFFSAGLSPYNSCHLTIIFAKFFVAYKLCILYFIK